MDFDEYQRKAAEFAIYSREESPRTVPSVYPYLGLSEEAGEVVGKLAKFVRDGGSSGDFRQAVRKELGDVLWMVANIANDLAIPLSEIAEGNIEKLEDRRARNVIGGSGDDR